MKDACVVVATLRAAKGKGDALAALLTEQAAVVRREEPDCLVYRPHRSPADPELFLFYEVYRNQAAFELHGKTPYLAAFRARREREGLIDGKTDVRVFAALTD
jgi:quinol monooxygenase YgiN